MSEDTAEGFDEVTAVNPRGVWTFMKRELIQAAGRRGSTGQRDRHG